MGDDRAGEGPSRDDGDAPGSLGVSSRSLGQEIRRLAFPAALHNLLLTAQFIVDTKMVGAFGGDDPAPLASVAIAGPVAWSSTVVATFTAVAATALVARRVGESKPRVASEVAITALVLSLLLGAVVGGLGALGCAPGIAWLSEVSGGTHSEPTLEGATGYLFWFFLLFPARTAFATLAASFRGSGDARSPLYVAGLGNVVNIAANAVFIFGLWGAPRMGTAGAGLGGSIAAGVEALALVWIWRRGKTPDLPWAEGFRGVNWKWVGALARIGWPALLEGVVFHTGFLVYQLAIFSLAESAVAAHRVAITLQSLAFMPAAGFYVSASSLSGRLLGANDPDAARRAAGLNLRYGVMFMLPVSALFFFAAEPLCAQFSTDAEVVRFAAVALQIGAIEIPFLLITESLRGTLRGAGETRGPLWVATLGTWFIRVPAAWAFAADWGCGWGLAGVWYATVTDWIVRAALLAILFRRGRWMQVRV